jgi:hypothetical protein
MAISTYLATLKWGTTKDQVAKVIDIKEFPDLIGEPNMLETTTLSDGAQTYIPGIKAMDSMAFLFNYTKEDFAKVKADEGKPLFYELSFSDGSKFSWQGSHTATLAGKGVDEVVEAGITIAPSTEVEFSET